MLRASADCRELLSAGAERDWQRQIPEMEWSVAQAVAHVAEGLLWLASDVAAGEYLAGGQEALDTMDLRVRPETKPSGLVATLGSFAIVLARVIDHAPPTMRGWHPWGGQPDACGFAAIACDEMLIHTHDAAQGLALPFAPSAELARLTVQRLFPWAPADTDPWHTLLWANDRADLPGQERQTGWRWHCAPLAEWNGVNPRIPPPRPEPLRATPRSPIVMDL